MMNPCQPTISYHWFHSVLVVSIFLMQIMGSINTTFDDILSHITICKKILMYYNLMIYSFTLIFLEFLLRY